MIYKLLGSLSLALSTCVLIFVLPKTIGLELYGEYSYVLALFNLFFGCSILHFNTAYVHFGSQFIVSRSRFNTLFALISVSIVIAFMVAIQTKTELVTTWLFSMNSTSVPVVLIASVASLQFILTRLTEFADVCSQTTKVEIWKVVGRVAFASLVLFYWLRGILTLELALWVNIVCFVFSVLPCSVHIKRSVVFKRPELGDLLRFVRFASPLMGFLIVSSVWMVLGRYFLQQDSGSGDSGLFSFSYSSVALPMGVVASLASLILARVSSSKNDAEMCKTLQKNWGLPHLISCSTCVFILFNSDQLVLMIAGEEFVSAASLLVILCGYSYFSFWGMLFSIVFNARNINTLYLKLNMVVSVISMIGLYSFYSLFTLDASVLCWFILLTYVTRALLQFLFIRRYLVSINWQYWLSYFVGSLLGFSLVCLVCDALKVDILGEIIIYVFAFTLFLLWSKHTRRLSFF